MAVLPAIEEYEAGLCDYLAEHVPDWWPERPYDVDESALLEFERRLYETDWFGVWLPATIGGQALGRPYQIAFERALARFGVPDRLCRVGQNLLLPTLADFGTETQLARFAAPTRRGDIVWCQGFSEPDAGSDLASVRTRAKPVPGGFRVEGQKTWTTLAHLASHCFALVRSSDVNDRHGGLSILMLDMSVAGVEYRRIRQIDGQSDFSEVFFDGVFVPEENLLGDEGRGWEVAMHTLQHERSTANFARQVRFDAQVTRLGALLRRGDGLEDYARYRDALGAAAASATALELAAQHIAERESRALPLTVEGARTKLYWSEAHQELSRLGFELATQLRSQGTASDDDLTFWRQLYLSSRAETIYAGTSEIQRTIIAKRSLRVGE